MILAVVMVAAPARAASVVGAGGMYAGGAQLPVVKGQIEVQVQGAFADVVVKQTFKNDLDKGIEAIYVFPLPGDAAVRSMTIKTGDQTITSEIARREDARRAYEDAVSTGAIGALTEEERANVFTQQVTGIAAKAEVVVELRFDMTVGRWRDGWELSLPLVVAPRHVPGEATGELTKGTGTAPDTTEVDDASRITPPVRGDGGGNPLTATIDLGDVDADDVDVPTHEVALTRRKGHTVATIKDVRSDRDLVVRWTDEDAGGASAIAERTDDGGVIAVTIEAPRPASTAKRANKRWILVLDVSGSMDGSALVLLRRAAKALIDRIPDEQLAILGPKGGSLKWRRGERGLGLSKKTIDATDATGGTSLGDLIGSAIANDASDDIAIVVISDGLVADDAAVAARVDGSRARVHTIGVGSAPNRWLLSEIAKRGRGVSHVLGAGDDVDAAIADLVASAGAPAVTPSVDWGGLSVRDITPTTLPALAAGASMVISARLERVTDAKLTVYAGDAAFEARIDEESAGDAGLAARRWARSRVDDLVAMGAGAEAIAQLGVTYGLVTPHTALIARGEEITVKGGVKTTVTIPVAMPAGMKWQSVFGLDGDVGETLYPPPDVDETEVSDSTNVEEKDQDKPKGKKKEPRRDADGTAPPKPVDVATGGAGGGDAPTDYGDEDEESPRAPEAQPTIDAGSNAGWYEAEDILLHGEVLGQRGWSGAVSLTGGLHVREDDRGGALGVSVAVSHPVTRTWQLGLLGRVQDAPSIDGGVAVDVYAGARHLVFLAGIPVLTFEAGAGLSLDAPGLAWRVGLRLGGWRVAPVFGVDQTYTRESDQPGWSPRTTVAGGLEWRF